MIKRKNVYKKKKLLMRKKKNKKTLTDFSLVSSRLREEGFERQETVQLRRRVESVMCRREKEYLVMK